MSKIIPLKTLFLDTLIIGENDTGKTLLLKTLYVAVRSMEEYRRGQDIRTYRQTLDNKLTWTFQLKKVGDLVRKGEGNRFRFEAVISSQKIFLPLGSPLKKVWARL